MKDSTSKTGTCKTGTCKTVKAHVRQSGTCEKVAHVRQPSAFRVTYKTGTRKTVKAHVRQSGPCKTASHVRQPRPESGLGFQTKSLKTV